MSRNLAKLLADDKSELTKSIAKLEEACGFPSEDVRILAENKQILRGKIHQLGLDPGDTTDRELYHALRARFEKDSQMLDKTLGIDQNTKLGEKIDKAIQLINHCAKTDEVWVAKNSVARSALIKFPPKHLAKALHYRSMWSMLKRQDIAELYLAGAVFESRTWQKNVANYLGHHNVSRYELRPAKIVNLAAVSWDATASPDSYVVLNKQLGAVALWPHEQLNRASVLCLAILLLEGLRSLNPSGYSDAIHELSPSLNWWADAVKVISDGDYPVSFNLKDVAYNHLQGRGVENSVRHHGVRELWDELIARYQTISSSLTDKMPDIQTDFGGGRSTKLPTSADLAEEFAVVE